MTSALAPIEVPLAETEAFQELLSRVGRKTGKIPPELIVSHVLSCVPPQEWPTRVEAMDAVLAPNRLDQARQPSGRGAAGRRAVARFVRHAAHRLGLATLSHSLAWHRSDRGSLRLPRLPQKLARALQASSGGARAPPHATATSAAGQEGTRVERLFPPRRSPLEPPSPADGHRRLAGSGRMERRLRRRQSPVYARRTCRPLVPLHRRRWCLSEKQLPRQARSPARARRRPVEDRSGCRAGIAS